MINSMYNRRQHDKPSDAYLELKCGVRVSIFLDPEGNVTVSDFFEWMIPVIHSLNPSNERISTLLKAMKAEEKDYVTLHDDQE